MSFEMSVANLFCHIRLIRWYGAAQLWGIFSVLSHPQGYSLGRAGQHLHMGGTSNVFLVARGTRCNSHLVAQPANVINLLQGFP